MNKIREQLLDEMEKQFALRGYRDYIDCHFGEALDVMNHGGTMYDLDEIVHLQGLLGFNVSYELYNYIDSACIYEDTSIMELNDMDVTNLMVLCAEYTTES